MPSPFLSALSALVLPLAAAPAQAWSALLPASAARDAAASRAATGAAGAAARADATPADPIPADRAPLAGAAADPATRAATVLTTHRAFRIAHVGPQLVTASPLHAALCAELVPNTGSIEYFPTTSTLLVRGTPESIDAVAAILAERDRAPAQVLLEIQFVELASPEQAAQALGCEPAALTAAVRVLDDPAAAAVRARLRDAGAPVRQVPKLVALDGQVAAIYVGERVEPQLPADGSVLGSLQPGTLDLRAAVALQGDGRVRLDLMARTAHTSRDGSVDSWPVLLGADQVAVVQKFAARDRGGLLFVRARPISDPEQESTPR